MIRIELVCVGSELLMGKVNAHAAYFAERLEAAGFALSRETTVGDDPREMRDVFASAWRRADVVLCSGGLGPTFDDITREVWSKVTGRRLVFRPALAREIEARFRRRGLLMPRENRRQGYVLAGADVIENENGTAPGQRLTAGRKTLFLFPGPGRELQPMAERALLPFLRRHSGGSARATRVFRFFGQAESSVDERLDAVRRVARPPAGARLVWGILAQKNVIDVKATAEGAPGAVAAALERVGAAMRRRFGKEIFGEGAETLEQAAGRRLAARGKTLAVAESCTGGLLGARLTAVPGSSDYFLGGFITYSNAAKTALLGVKRATLARRGAVSAECAREMASGARRRTGADYALAVTGIAGPAGGTAEKPVGLVFIALAGPRRAAARRFRFGGSRDQVRERSASTALDWLRRELA